MKKKLLALLVVMVLAVTLIVATACDDTGMIVKNNKRNMTQITATVKYGGRSSQVDKSELNATISNFVYQYYYYYSQGYIGASQYASVLSNIGTSYKQANQSMAQSEAYTLKCIEVLYGNVMDGSDEGKKAAAQAASTVGKSYSVKARIAEIESVLPEKDLIKARKDYNEQMQDSFDSYREAYDEELEKANKSTKSEVNIKRVNIESEPAIKVYEVGDSKLNLNGLKVSVTYKGATDDEDGETVELDRSEFTVTGFNSEEAVEEQEIKVTFGNVSATFNVQIVAAKPARPAMPEDEEEEEDGELEERFEVTLQQKIDQAKADGDLDEQKALKEARRRLLKNMEDSYRDYDYYYLSVLKAQAVASVEDALGESVVVEDGEVEVKYTEMFDAQLEALTSGATTYANALTENGKTQVVHKDVDENGEFYVQHVLFKLTDDLQALYDDFAAQKVANEDALTVYKNSLSDQIGVWISNVKYDKDAVCEEEDCACTACENYKGEAPGECTAEDCQCVECRSNRFINQQFAEDNNLTAKLNEDGTLNVLDVIDVMYAELGKVASDNVGASALEKNKAMLDAFRKWIYMCNEDEGGFTSLSNGELGYKLSKTESSYVANFTALSRALAYGATPQEIADWHIVGEGVGAYGWCYTEYGIHVIMVTGFACDVNDSNVSTVPGNEAYSKTGLDYVSNIWEYEVVEGETQGTVRYYIKEQLRTDKETAVKGDFKKDFYQNEVKENAEISYNNNYQDLVDQYKA